VDLAIRRFFGHAETAGDPKSLTKQIFIGSCQEGDTECWGDGDGLLILEAFPKGWPCRMTFGHPIPRGYIPWGGPESMQIYTSSRHPGIRDQVSPHPARGPKAMATTLPAHCGTGPGALHRMGDGHFGRSDHLVAEVQ
jgi:hypothetical protein